MQIGSGIPKMWASNAVLLAFSATVYIIDLDILKATLYLINTV